MSDKGRETFKEEGDKILAEFELLRAQALLKMDVAVDLAKAQLRLSEARMALLHSLQDWLESSNGFWGAIRAARKRVSVLECTRSVESAALAVSELGKKAGGHADDEANESVREALADVARCKNVLRGA